MLLEDSEDDCEEAIALLFHSVAADWKWVSPKYSQNNMKLSNQYCFGTFCDSRVLFA